MSLGIISQSIGLNFILYIEQNENSFGLYETFKAYCEFEA